MGYVSASSFSDTLSARGVSLGHSAGPKEAWGGGASGDEMVLPVEATLWNVAIFEYNWLLPGDGI